MATLRRTRGSQQPDKAAGKFDTVFASMMAGQFSVPAFSARRTARRSMSRTAAASLLMAACIVSGCAAHAPSRTLVREASLPAEVGDSCQVLLVESSQPGPQHARLTALERDGAAWRVVLGPVDAVIGRAGFAPPGEKREGDGRSPSGVYRLESAFGYAKEVSTRIAYRQAMADDVWVDDVASDAYNTWVKRPTKATSFEVLRREDDLYELAVVIGYNTDPVVKGQGSAIFLHVWRGRGAPTAGCVALAKSDVAALLAWLDPAKDPRIVMGASRQFVSP